MPTSPRTGSRIPLALLVAGIGLLVLNAVLMLRFDWRPLEVPLSVTGGQIVSEDFTAARSGTYEIQIEVSRAVPREAIDMIIAVVDRPSPLDLSWTVHQGDTRLAAGNAREYLFLDLGPRRWPGRFRRILMRVPTGQDDLFWRTFGLAGHTTAARGIGRFQANAGNDYRVGIGLRSDLQALAAGAPKLVVRGGRADAERHYRRIAPLGYAGLILVTLGGLLVITRFLRHRL